MAALTTVTAHAVLVGLPPADKGAVAAAVAVSAAAISSATRIASTLARRQIGRSTATPRSRSVFGPEGDFAAEEITAQGGIPATTRLLARRFAADGFPSLVIAYFDAPGLPQALEDIPLEYFQHALEWLARQPQVNAGRISVLGISRGSEAALLLGVHYPSLVHGVLALDPSNHPGCGITYSVRRMRSGPAWIFQGKPVPYSRQFDNPEPTDAPSAVIPVERFKAPLLLACSRSDTIWISCTYADAILSRLTSEHSRISRVLYEYPNASHGVGALLPDEPGRAELRLGDSRRRKVREHLWPHVLSFLRKLG